MKRVPTWGWLAVALVIAVAPAFVPAEPSRWRVGSLFFLSLALMAGLHVVTGLTRVVSLCHAALVGVGAYSGALASIRLGLTPVVSVVVGAGVAGVVALVLAWATRVLEDHYLALATLACSEILTNVFRSATALTGGANGLSGVPPLSLGGLTLSTPDKYFPLCVAVGVTALYAARWLDGSALGRALRAMGDEGPLVESLAVRSSTLRAIGFAVGGAMAGLAGATFAHVDGFVGPESFGVTTSIGYLCYLVIGGLGRLRGVVLAALFASLGLELLRGLHEWQMVVVASLALLVLYLRDVGVRRWWVVFLKQGRRARMRASHG